jgi:hypothetical protein
MAAEISSGWAEIERLRVGIEAWMAANAPGTLDGLRLDRHGLMALDQAAAIARNLARAAAVRADPASADPSQGDGYYLLDHPEGLEAAMVAGLAGDREYWELQLRWLPMPAEMPADPTAEHPRS